MRESVHTPGQLAAVRAAKARRGELGMTQRQLAELADIHYRTIQDFERGATWPHSTTLAKLERVLGWRPGMLAELAAAHDDPDGGATSADIEQSRATVAALERVLGAEKARLDELERAWRRRTHR